MASVTISGGEELRTYLSKIPTKIFGAAKAEIRTAVITVQRNITARIGNASPLNRRTGTLARSMQFAVTGTNLETLSASVYSVAALSDGTPIKYALLQENGGTIHARNKYSRVPGGPYLNIPLPANRTAAGVQRLSAREVFATGGRIVGSPARGYVILGKRGDGFVPMFALKTNVRIPPRLGMVNTALSEVDPLLARLNTAIQQALLSG